MATPHCPSSDCNGTSFEMKTFEPYNSRFKLNAVQCRMCGAVVGVMEYANVGDTLDGIVATLKKLGGAISSIESKLRQLT